MGESIENRPESMNDRTEFGHWEIDTVVGLRDSSEVLLTLDERVTRQLITLKISSRTAKAVNEAVSKIINEYDDKATQIFKSIRECKIKCVSQKKLAHFILHSHF